MITKYRNDAFDYSLDKVKLYFHEILVEDVLNAQGISPDLTGLTIIAAVRHNGYQELWDNGKQHRKLLGELQDTAQGAGDLDSGRISLFDFHQH